ncbi:enhancer of split M1 protein-like [Cochliomyia hominivorax]
MKYFSIIILALFFLCTVQAKCPTFCPSLVEPICGFNGGCYRQFDNTCLMFFENCNRKQDFRKVSMENCNKIETPKC